MPSLLASTGQPRRLPKPEGSGWALVYVIVAAASVIGAFVRGALAYALLWPLLKILGDSTAVVVPVANLVAFGPIALSLLALAWPAGAGWWWRQTSGGRRPSAREQAAYEESCRALQDDNRGLKLARSWFVTDEPIMLTRPMLESEWLECTIAHELGHLYGMDARLTSALNRLVFLPQLMLRHRGLAYYAWYLASGALALAITLPIWGAFFRSREYAADYYAHTLGQGQAFADFLEAEGLEYDRPVPFVWMSTHTHPPVELRIDRLRSYQDQPLPGEQPGEVAERAEPVKPASDAIGDGEAARAGLTEPARPAPSSLRRSGDLLPGQAQASTKHSP